MTVLQFFLTAFIAFAVFAGIGLFLNFCRRRLRKTGHGLSGMCHRDGGPACSSCRDPIEKK